MPGHTFFVYNVNMSKKPSKKEADIYALELVQSPGIRSTRDLARDVAETFDEPFGTARGRVERAYKQISSNDRQAKPYRKHQVIQTLVEMIRVSWRNYLETGVAQHAAVAGGAIKELAKIDGMYEAVELEISGRKIEQMSPHEQREYIRKTFSNPEVKGLLGGMLPDNIKTDIAAQDEQKDSGGKEE